MKFTVLRILIILFVVAGISSCGMNRWARMNYRGHYVKKQQYRKFHEHRNRDW